MELLAGFLSFSFDSFVRLYGALTVSLLVGFIWVTNWLQRTSTGEVFVVLAHVDPDVQKTELFGATREYFERRQAPPFIKAVHLVPFLFLLGITFFFSSVAYFGGEYPKITTIPSYVLGGIMVFTANPADLAAYQSSTLFMASIAFLVAYIKTIAMLTRRINNADMSPISYHFLSINILSAVLVALVARHILPVIPILDNATKVPGNPYWLAAVGFLIGWNPALWLDVIWRRLYDILKIRVLNQRPPHEENLPLDLNLKMIQGLSPDKIDRLNELGIDNCQDLAKENAIIVWLRTPYTLELVCDWVAQAQLCILYEDSKLQLLRMVGVRDIFAYMAAIATPEGRTAIIAVLQTGATGVTPAETDTILATLRSAIAGSPCYKQLEELWKALGITTPSAPAPIPI